MALLVLILAVLAIWFTRSPSPEPRQFSLPVTSEPELTAEEVRLVAFDRFDLEIPVRVTVDVPEDDAGRYRAIIAELQQLVREQEGWPEGLPLPEVYEVRGNVVLDFHPPEGFSVDEDTERRLRQSLEATLVAAGAGSVSFLLSGEPAGVMLEHEPVPAGI